MSEEKVSANALSHPVTKRKAGNHTPQVHCQDTARNRSVVALLPQLQEAFRPTPWLFNAHAQVIYHSLRAGKKEAGRYNHRNELTMSDGGRTALVWRDHDLPADTPTIVVMHSLNGSPQGAARLVDLLNRITGWRIVLCVRRGHAGLPLTTPRFSMFGSTDDLREQLQAIRTRVPQSPLFGVGVSAGSAELVRYLGEEGAAAPFRATFAYCPGYDTDTGFDNVHPFYSRTLARRLVKQFITPNLTALAQLETLPHLQNARELKEFQNNSYELAGYDCFDDYARAINPTLTYQNIKTPLMLLNAEDDPVCHISNAGPYLDRVKRMANIILVTTATGSHCAFYEGWTARSWSGRLIADYFLAMQYTENGADRR